MDGLLITRMAIPVAPLLGAALLTAVYTRTATAALSSPRVGAPVTLRRAQSPYALCRGDRACFMGKEPREAGGLAEPFGLILAEHPRCPLEGRSLAKRKPSRGSPGLESLVLREIF